MKRILVLGFGGATDRRIRWPGAEGDDLRDEGEVWTHDIDTSLRPNFDFNLEDPILALPSEYYDEIHAYEVLEHVGTQGDAEFFFAQFAEFDRILKPGGHIAISVPDWQQAIAWGVPDHKRVLPPGIFTFLDATYEERLKGVQGVGNYKRLRDKTDLRVVMATVHGTSSYVLLQKPAHEAA